MGNPVKRIYVSSYANCVVAWRSKDNTGIPKWLDEKFLAFPASSFFYLST